MEKEKNKRNLVNKKVISLIFIVFLCVFITVISLITLFCTVRTSNLAFGKYSFYIMESDAQPEIAKKGDLVITKKVKYGEIKPGDKIVCGDGEFYYCDKIEQTTKKTAITKVMTVQDDGINYQLSEEDVRGKVINSVEGVGNIITFLRTPIGVILYIIFIICVFLVMWKLFITKKD